MSLIEKTITDKIEVVGEFKKIQVRQDNLIVDDATDEIKSRGNFHRYVLSPGADLSGQPDDVAAIANAVWTDEIKTAYTAHVEANSPV
jgi:hypothetical protein